jgi:hypothetical protein
MANRGSGRASATRSERRRAAVARRRREAKRAVMSLQRRERSRKLRRSALVGGGAVVVAALVGGVAVLTRDGGDDGPPVTAALTGTVLAETGAVLPVTDVLDAYRVTYRIESEDTEGALTTRTQEIAVRRPFDAHIRRAAGGDGTSAVDVAGNLGIYADLTSADAEVASVIPPAIALGDLRLDGVLDDLVGAGLLVPRERREVAGRECQVYRTGQALELQELAAPTDTEYADACVDASGLLLEQVVVSGGDTLFYEIATEVDVAPALGDDDFAYDSEPIALEDGGSELAELPTDAAPTTGYWAFPSAPAGYEHVGRYALRSLAPDDGSTTTTVGVGAPATVETYYDVYRSGADFVIVHQGEASQSPGRDTTLGADVDAGALSALGAARVAYGLAGSTLAVNGETWFVEVTAPMPAADLGALASSLVASG